MPDTSSQTHANILRAVRLLRSEVREVRRVAKSKNRSKWFDITESTLSSLHEEVMTVRDHSEGSGPARNFVKECRCQSLEVTISRQSMSRRRKRLRPHGRRLRNFVPSEAGIKHPGRLPRRQCRVRAAFSCEHARAQFGNCITAQRVGMRMLRAP